MIKYIGSIIYTVYIVLYTQYTRVIQKLKIQIGWQGKGNHRCEGGNTVVSSILPFQFVLAGQKVQDDEEVKTKVTTQLWAQVGEFCVIRI
jgi:hypothetical protein